MKIAIISARADPYIHPVDVHGGTTIVVNLIDSLISRGHEIHVFTRLDKYNSTNDEYKNKRALMQQEKGIGVHKVKQGLTVYRMPYSSYPNFPEIWENKLEESMSFLSNVYPFLQDLKPDVIHYFHMLSVAGWYKLLGKIPFADRSTFSPLLLSINRQFEKLSEERILMENRILSDFPIISSQSEGEINAIVELHHIQKNKTILIPLGVNTKIYYEKLSYISTTYPNKFILISPNTIKPQKKQVEVVKITKQLLALGHNVITVFMGNVTDDQYRMELSQVIVEENLSYKVLDYLPTTSEIKEIGVNILFLPTQSEQELANFIRSGDIAIFPSTDEGYSLLNINCLACGTPIACYDKTEYSEYLNENNKLLTIKGDAPYSVFVYKINAILSNKDALIDLSKKSALSVQKFSWDRLIDNQIGVYKSLTN